MKTIVIGALNTDFIVSGVTEFPQPGEYVYGDELQIMPGGRSRNIASMLSQLASPDDIAVVGRTVKDPYGLWNVPIDALNKAGVNTQYVHFAEYSKVKKLPGIIIIPVDKKGSHQMYALPSITRDFSVQDIEQARPLFENVGRQKGTLVITLEAPVKTATYAAKLANKLGCRVIVDPGGIEPAMDVSDLLKSGVFLIKPNEQEARLLTGVEITDFESAKAAAQILQQQGAQNVFITVGAQGAYLFTAKEQLHIPIPQLTAGIQKDETGCGDQALAVFCHDIQQGNSLVKAAEHAVYAGTLQFYKQGIQPLTRQELTTVVPS